MIKIYNTSVWGFEGAIRGMRMPFESFDKSDSGWVAECDYGCPNFNNMDCNRDSVFVDKDSFCKKHYSIGSNDMTLAKKLIRGGSEHRKFLRMIHVQAEVLAPRYWWAEMDTYKHVTKNSSSTMHLITKRELTLDDFSNDYGIFSVEYKDAIERINRNIKIYNNPNTGSSDKQAIFERIKRILPEGFMQLRTIDTNYECLLNIYHQRKNHRLLEWKDFCSWELTLPYFKEFIGALEC